MGNDCYQDFLDLLKANPGSAAARKALQGAAAATNFRAQPGMPPPGPFDVWTFDKRRAQARLEAAFKSKGSTGGSKQVLTPLTAYDLDSLGALFGKGPAAGQTRVRRSSLVLRTVNAFRSAVGIVSCTRASGKGSHASPLRCGATPQATSTARRRLQVSRQTESGAFEVQTVSNRRDKKEDALCASCGARRPRSCALAAAPCATAARAASGRTGSTAATAQGAVR